MRTRKAAILRRIDAVTTAPPNEELVRGLRVLLHSALMMLAMRIRAGISHLEAIQRAMEQGKVNEGGLRPSERLGYEEGGLNAWPEFVAPYINIDFLSSTVDCCWQGG